MASNSFKVKNSLVLTPKDLSTLTSPEAGDLACDINDSNKIKRYDAASASWVEVGSGGGVGGVDIFFVQDFESASLSSFTQTGLVLSQTDPLKGKVSAVLNHQAGTSPTNDQKFKQIIPVDRKFRGQSMVLRLDSKSDASQGNLVINIYDETNSANLVSSEQLQLSNDVNGRKTSVSFTIPETCASLSYTITALPESGKVSRIDDIICELSESALLETSVVTPNVTAWQGYTPTFQGFGTAPTGPTNIEFEWRQVGENVEIRGKFRTGTTTAVEARVGLPAGLSSAGTNLIPSIQSAGTIALTGEVNTNQRSVLIEPSVTYVTFASVSNTTPFTKQNANSLIGSGVDLSFFASIPCSGLSATTTKTIPLTQSGLVQNPDSALRINGVLGYGSTNTRVIRFNNSGIQDNLGSAITYNPNSILGDSFTINEDGIYNINATIAFNSTSDGAFPFILKNPSNPNVVFSSHSPASVLSHTYTHGGALANPDMPISATVRLIKGDVIWFTNSASSPISISTDVLRSFVQITRQSSLKQVSVSSDQKITIPTSELRMEGASSRGSTDTAIVRFDNIAKIRGDAFTVESDSVLGTRITMKKAGLLNVSTSLRYLAGVQVAITKNLANLTGTLTASEILATEYSSGVDDVYSVSCSTFVNIGDIIRIHSTINPTSNSSNNLNLAFQEQDISVSVTNTLPQFSESDSSVRVDTANGYGSTGTYIRRFSNIRDNIGPDIAYNDGSQGIPAQVGDYFVVKTSGIYLISYSDTFNNTAVLGLSKNSSQLTTSISQINVADRLAISQTSAANVRGNVSWQGYLQSQDIIRAHTEAAPTGALPSQTQFTISKVGKPNVTGVDVTPFVNVPQPEQQVILLSGGSASAAADITNFTVSKNTNNGIVSYSNGRITALKRCKVSTTLGITAGASGDFYPAIFKNGVNASSVAYTFAISGYAPSVSYEDILEAGEYLTYRPNNISGAGAKVSLTAEALSDQILTAPETFSTDTAALVYAPSSTYTLSTLANAPVGTYITFTYAANTNTRTQTTLTNRPTQTDADMNVNGIQIFTRAFNAPSTAGNPACIAIQIGKGLKGININGYPNSGKSGFISLDYNENGTTKYGIPHKNYNETTGILLIDSAYTPSGSNNAAGFLIDGGSSVTSGYLVINASKNVSLTGMNIERVSARAVNTSGQAIGTSAVMNFDAVPTFDTHGGFTSNSYIVKETGYYQVNASAAASATLSTTQAMSIGIRVNGTTVSTGVVRGNGAANIWYPKTNDVLYLKKDDVVTVLVASDVSISLTAAGGGTFNYLSLAKTNIGGRN